MKKVVVLSVGGSIIMPAEKSDKNFLHELKETLRKKYRKSKFVLVCGGGYVARAYISQLKKEGKSEKEQSLAGIRATRMNAELLMQFFGKEANQKLPKSMKEVKDNLSKNNVVICGALRYAPKETSDSSAAKLAKYLKSDFINITNINGLYTEDPKKHRNAKFINKISWSDFERMASRIPYKPGQHFVLDHDAAKTIKTNKIKTIILGKNTKNLEKALEGKKYLGTEING